LVNEISLYLCLLSICHFIIQSLAIWGGWKAYELECIYNWPHTHIYIGHFYFFKNAKISPHPQYNTVCNMVIKSPSSSYANVISEVLTVMTMKGCHLLVCAFFRCDIQWL